MGYFTAQKQRNVNASTKMWTAVFMLPFRLAWIAGKAVVGLVRVVLGLFGVGAKSRKKRK